MLLNLTDPANPFGTLFPITDAAGKPVKILNTPTKYLILQRGQPIVIYEERVTLLEDLPRETITAALQLLMGLVDDAKGPMPRDEICVRQWNYHPTHISPARHLLLSLGFYEVSNPHKRFVYDGINQPEASTMRVRAAGTSGRLRTGR